MCSRYSYEDIETVVRTIETKTEIRPKIGIICGSGLGGLAEDLDTDKPKNVISYKDIPRFPQTTGMLLWSYEESAIIQLSVYLAIIQWLLAVKISNTFTKIAFCEVDLIRIHVE